ncbi:MAG TPA: ABC transporter ATP-binding protein [Candidatus Dormibacteraeota bacterium]|nr:ABC transporter ATP-binding protein [Candidatus Dormibacteraeota bacterium]
MIGTRFLPASLEQRARSLQRSAAWALRAAWSTSPSLLLGVTGVSLVRGLIPAGLALSARGIVNGAVAGLHGAAPALEPLLPWLLLGFALTVIEGLGGLAGPLMRQRLRDDLACRLTSEIMAHAATLDLSFFEDPRAQDALQRAKDDPAGHVTTFLANAISAASNALQIASLVAILVVIEPWVVAVVLLLTVPYLWSQARLTAEQHALERTRTAKRRWTGYFVGNLTGAASAGEVQLLRLAPLLIQRFRALMEEFRGQDWRLARRGFGRGAGFVTLATLAIYAAFVHVCWRALHGGLSIGDLAIFGAASARMRQTLESFVQLGTQALGETLYVTDVIDFLAARPRRDVAPLASLPALSRAGLELRDVHFTYPGAAEPALCGIDLHIAPGETVALVGENGAGKTTLVKLLARLYDPDQGSILFDGSDLRDLPREQLQQRIAFVFQGFGRYEASAAENIAYGDWARLLDDRAAVAAVARTAGIDALLAGLPRGYDTHLGRLFGDTDLSAGQWQKLAVARAFARQAALLILDEPTSNLDARAEHALFEQFRALAEGRTTIIVSHRFSTVSMAQRIVVLDKGRVVETGTHAELLARAGHYATLYSLHERTGLRAAG